MFDITNSLGDSCYYLAALYPFFIDRNAGKNKTVSFSALIWAGKDRKLTTMLVIVAHTLNTSPQETEAAYSVGLMLV